MLCPSCGVKIDDYSSFCSNCGKAVGQVASARGIVPSQRPQDKVRAYTISIIVAAVCVGIFVWSAASQEGTAYAVRQPLIILELQAIIIIGSLIEWYLFSTKAIMVRLTSAFLNLHIRIWGQPYSESRESEHFKQEQKASADFIRRATEVLVWTFGLASYCLSICLPWPVCFDSNIVQSSLAIAMFEFTLVFLAFAPIIFVPLWMLEDAKVRHFHKSSSKCNVPGEHLKEFASAVGLILSIVALAFAVTSVIELSADFLAIAIFIFPPSFLSTAFFLYNREPSLLRALIENKVMKRLRTGGLQLSNQLD